MEITYTNLSGDTLELTGRDAASFLQGYVTNDMDELTPEFWHPGAFCNLQGRVIANFRMISYQDVILARMQPGMVTVMQEFLKKYIVFSKATMRNTAGDWVQLGLAGSGAAAYLKDLFGEPDGQNRHCRLSDDGVALTLPGEHPRFEVWLNPGAELVNTISNTIDPMPPGQWDLLEIEAGWPWINENSANQYLPQMLNLQAQGAVSFTKGCYLGQEIVARAQYRGQLKKHMQRFEVDQSIEAGDALVTADGSSAGDIIAASASDNRTQFLAVTRKDAENSLQLPSGSIARVLPLPYAIIEQDLDG